MALRSPAPNGHDWGFVGANAGGGSGNPLAPVLIAACRRCGTIRAQVINTGKTESRIDLSGAC